ncbi:MAG: N-acetyl-D-Glu racemase DgcA [Pseudomonadota bacterium]
MGRKRAERDSDGPPLTLSARVQHWPIRGQFTIARGSKSEAVVVLAELSDGIATGQGECVPYARYGESVDSVVSAIEKLRPELDGGLDLNRLQVLLPPGAARNAVDCALWDLQAKRSGLSAAALANLTPLHAVQTAFTISLGEPAVMAAKARESATHPLLKLKLGGDGDADRMRAVRDAVPGARLIVDANESWRKDLVQPLLAVAAETAIELVEQPLPAGEDSFLAEIVHDVPICADESAHDSTGLGRLVGHYDAVNIKLDKTGGLTEALRMADQALALDIRVMVGCMVATSLAMAPAILVAQKADWVDLDGPLLIARDRDPALAYADGEVHPPSPALWG